MLQAPVLRADPTKGVLQVSYALLEPATTEVLLCDLLGRVWATPLPAAGRPAGRYLHHARLGPLPPARYLLVLYCNGVRTKATYLMVE
ncbi:hypothetical protein GCM10023185_34040 [Hymenobacter saemangeumensis]|uniref:T9SS type A sorting domain-containing protein n=1 Tax=Hymenobacter saemangeumensis TaxID=1084522 RepID=A0ABP8INM9_9BACT